MKIGIPRAFLYYKYHDLWESFFEGLGVDYVVSPYTNKDIVTSGMNAAIDEACLSSKIYLGHVNWLIGKCDYIFVPRVSGFGSAGTVCTKFNAIYDVVQNTFKDTDIKLLDFNIDDKITENEMLSFVALGKRLGKKKSQCVWAYLGAKQSENAARMIEEKEFEKQITDKSGKSKILLVAHRYNICDQYIGQTVLNIISELGAIPIIADYSNKREALAHYGKISKTLPWAFNRELVGAVEIAKNKVDGIILMTTFPCGPDSLINEIISRRVNEVPVLNIILDGQEGSAGLETRIESFLDIIDFKKEDKEIRVLKDVF